MSQFLRKSEYGLVPLVLLLLSLVLFLTLEAKPSLSASKKVEELTKIPSELDGMIQLPLRVYLINDLHIEKKGVALSPRISADDFEKKILPEINRIWKVANIQWVLEGIEEQPAAQFAKREEDIKYLEKAKRGTPEEPFEKRVPIIKKLCAVEQGHPVIHNLYLFPYMGETTQGVASLGGNWAISGVWTDKPFRAKKKPIEFPLVEKGPFKIGSVARTCSHELGHNLSLRHPDKATQTRFNRLMGGKKHGYELTPEEIRLARKTALKRAKKILSWAN